MGMRRIYLLNISMKFIQILVCLGFLTSLSFGASLRVIPWDKEVAKRDFWIGSGEKFSKVEDMDPKFRSAPIRVSNGEEGVFLELRDRPNQEGKFPRLSLKIPADSRQLLLLLVPSEKAPFKLLPIVMNDEVDGFPWGTIRILNVTSQPYVFQYEKEYTKLPVGFKPTNIRPGGARRKMEVGLYHPSDNKKKRYSAVWEQRPQMRKLVFITPQEDRARGAVEIKVITEKKPS